MSGAHRRPDRARVELPAPVVQRRSTAWQRPPRVMSPRTSLAIEQAVAAFAVFAAIWLAVWILTVSGGA